MIQVGLALPQAVIGHLLRQALHHADQLDQANSINRANVHRRPARRDQLLHIVVELGAINIHLTEHLVSVLRGEGRAEQHPYASGMTKDCRPHSGCKRLPLDVPRCGVYLFSEGDDHLNVAWIDRHREHWSGKINDAPFAFKLARHATSNLLKGGPTRNALEGDPVFASAFAAARIVSRQ